MPGSTHNIIARWVDRAAGYVFPFCYLLDDDPNSHGVDDTGDSKRYQRDGSTYVGKDPGENSNI